MERPFIVGLGGATRPNSSTELALSAALEVVRSQGCETVMFGGAFLSSLPHFHPSAPRGEAEKALLEAVRRADGVIVASPCYHGGISGLVKNALDLLEDTARDPSPYLDGRPVGLIITGHGWQGLGPALQALRAIVHALRGWPTPFGVTLNSAAGPAFGAGGQCNDEAIAKQLALLASQVAPFNRRATPSVRGAAPRAVE